MPVTIEQDLKEYLAEQFDKISQRFEQIDQRFEQIDQRFEQIDQRFEQIDRRFDKIDRKFEKIDNDITDLKVGQARLEEKIDGLDQRLEAKIDGLDKRLEFQEFINRGVLIGFIVAILAGLAKLFGFIPNA